FSDGESLGSGLGSQGHAISVFLGLLRSIEGLTPAPLAVCVCEANMELRALRRAAFSNPLILPSLGAFEPCVDAGHAGHHPNQIMKNASTEVARSQERSNLQGRIGMAESVGFEPTLRRPAGSLRRRGL